MKKINHVMKKKAAIYAKKISIDYDDKKYQKVRRHCHYTGEYRGAAHNICHLRYKAPKKVPVVFHNGSKYDYHFIIKELAEEFQGDFEFLIENTEKYITFSVPIEKKLKIIKYKIKFIDSVRFMPTSLSSLADNLSAGFYNNKCIDFKSSLKHKLTKNNLII